MFATTRVDHGDHPMLRRVFIPTSDGLGKNVVVRFKRVRGEEETMVPDNIETLFLSESFRIVMVVFCSWHLVASLWGVGL